jgi:dienelactone hydrolase
MKRVLGVVLAMATLSIVPPAAHADPVRLGLPAPTGKHRVGTTSLHLVDGAREDALAPTPRPRELMVRLWYPAARSQAPRAGYLTPGHSGALVEQLNAAAGTDYPAGLLTFPTHSRAGAPADGTRHPIVLLSPGYGGNAGWHTGLAEELASRGYVVAAMDHTFDVAVVEFPDGRLEPLATDEIADSDRSIATRAADTWFVLDELRAITQGRNPDFEHRRLPAGLGRALDLSRVAGLGFSRGSSAMVVALAADRRIDAGVALDGNPLGTFTLDRPFLMFGNRERHLPAVDADWAAFYDRLTGPRLYAVVDGMKHNDLTDLTVFKAVIDPSELLSVGIAVGPIDGERSLLVQRRYVATWLDFALRGRDDRLLSGESSHFPEVDFQP